MSLLHKKEKQNKNNDQLFRLMTPMIAGMLACIFCLVSMTWAWFTASVDAPTQKIQSATRSTRVMVYELDEEGNRKDNPIVPSMKSSGDADNLSVEPISDEDAEPGEAASGVTADDSLVWKLSPEASYEVNLTGDGDASQGYCKIEVSYNDKNGAAVTETYRTEAFKREKTFKFTYNTGGFPEVEGVTATEWNEYVEKTGPLTLTIASYWGSPAVETTPQVLRMSARNTAEEGIMLLSDGDVIGLAPIPCPEEKAETKVELEGFEIQEGTVISAEEDYKVSLTLKEGYEMPSEVVVNIGGKDYVVSTGGTEASTETPYFDAASGVLTVPSTLLSDGTKVSVKATATQIPAEEPEEEKTEEATEETTENKENEEDKSADTSSDNKLIADNPNKKEDDDDKNDEPVKTPIGYGGNDDDDEEDNSTSQGSSNDNASSSGNNEEETEDEKADVTLNLSQLTINLEETKIPTNADLVLTLSAKEDMELPERIVITLDKTIRDENIEDEEIEEDKTEYIINTDGKDNPEGFEFDAESGELTISSELLEGVREITIADTKENEDNEDEEKATLTFEVKNLTFDFTDDEIVTDEDVVITFTAGEGYELPETIIITIDGEEYIVYTSDKDSDKNPDGITFDTETGTLTISKDLLEDAEAITIAAEGVEKEDEESDDKEENPDADKKDESEDKDTGDKENETEGSEATDKEPENGTDTPDVEDKTETDGGTDAPGGENTETTDPEANPDNITDGEGNGENDGEGNGEDEDKTEALEPGTEPTIPTAPDTEDNTDTGQGGENAETENGEGTTEGKTEETPDAESGDNSETTTPTEPSEPVVTPETPKTETPGTSETSTPSAGTQASDNTSGTPASSAPTPGTDSNSNGASQASGTTTSSKSKETSSEE